MKPDLHMHSTFSDGVLSPMELVEKAAALGVEVMAITDHDTFAGIDSLQGTATTIPVITGVELSLRDMKGLHLLGYGRSAALPLRQKVAELAQKRVVRAKTMVQRLCDLGMPIDWDEMTRGYAGTVGRAHIGRALMAAGYVHSMQEAIDRFIGEGKPAYVAGKRLSMAEALPLMRQSGFVPVLAHPMLLEKDDITLRTLLGHWKNQGLMGVEVYHPSAMGYTQRLESMARGMNMLVTGGSDFHKEGDSHGMPGCMCRAWTRAGEDLACLMDALEQE